MNRIICMTLLVAALCCSCETEDFSIDPTLMPAATQKGANTFGCVIDGWVYTGGRYADPEAIYYPAADETENDTIVINTRTNEDERISFFIINPKEKGITIYSLSDTPEKEYNVFTNAVLHGRYGSTELGNGTVNITRFSKDMQIVSGTFEGDYIKDGRFDITYTNGGE